MKLTTGDEVSFFIGEVVRLVRLWSIRRTGRGELSRMSEYQLRDIGLTSADASREIRKPFWR